MRDIHPIRLRGPWQYEPLARFPPGDPHESTANLPPAGKAQVPCDWSATLGSDFRGRVRYRRAFGCPTAIEPHERIFLVITGATGEADVLLNGQPLGTIHDQQPARFNVTSQLSERNELQIDLTQPATAPQPGGLTGEIRLEIHGVEYS